MTKYKPENMIGKTNINTNGSIYMIKEYRKSTDITIIFIESGYECKTSMQYFRTGGIKCPYDKLVFDIGYLGEGPYSCKEHKYIYDKWHSMLRRCYSNKALDYNPTYTDCYVYEPWHCFQTFAQWFDENYYEVNNEIMELDKDILNKHNKEYGPDTCVIVPHNINSLFVKSDKSRGDLPIGVSYKKRINKYIAQLNYNNERKHLGTFKTPEEAFLCYKEAKEAYIKEVADKYIEYLPPHVYEAMYNWEVDIDD